MRETFSDKVQDSQYLGEHRNGAFRIKCGSAKLHVICSDGMGWDHVSVSLPTRTPTWEEMAYVKSLFFDDDEVVLEYHPAKSDYVNNHPFCLHLWRPQNETIPMPPVVCV